TPPFPPLPYNDAYFDILLGLSVFTHIPREAQDPWLQELQRIVTPGGLLLISTHGHSAAVFEHSETLSDRLETDGICDDLQDKSLDGIAPAGYYRIVFHSRQYIVEHWSKY